MGYRKLKGDALFDGYTIQEGKVLIVDDKGKVEAVVAESDAPDAEAFGGILTPGFINCHCHLELSHMKGLIPEGTGLVDFVFSVVTQRHFAEEEIKAAIAAGEQEMLRNGIVAVGDICNNVLTLPQKEERNLAYYNFIEASGWLPAVAQTRYERALQIYNEFTNHQQRASLVPHAPYSVSAGLWQRLKPHFKGKLVSIHNQETAQEDEFFRTGNGDFKRMYDLMKLDNTHHQPNGKSSLQSYFENLSEAAHVLLVHNTFTTQEDIDFIKGQTPNAKCQTFFCLCPNANLYIEKALPPVELLRSNDCSIILGTDSLASNRSLSIADEMKSLQKHYSAIALEEMLGWATLNGAKALQMDGQLGSFEKGKKPGVNLLQSGTLQVKCLA